MGIQEQRLYYGDSYMERFHSKVLKCTAVDDVYHVVCHQSAFYPSSGGQPNDTGWLGGAQVMDVMIGENNEVVHVVDRPLQAGTEVEGIIDWERRLDHMQHHCGQHILSACFEQDMNADTVGFHLGNEFVTIDLSIPELSVEEARQVERHANEIVWSNVDIRARFIDNDELPHIRLRHPPKVHQDIRIVSIGTFDDNACGGTHPRRTGEVGQIKLMKMEKSRHGVRLTFLCGKRALMDYGHKLDVLRQLSVLTSAGVDELVDSVEKLQSKLLSTQKSEDNLKRELAEFRSESCVKLANVTASGVRFLVHRMDPVADLQELKILAASVTAKLSDSPYAFALLGQSGNRVHVVAGSSGVVDVNHWLKLFLSDVGGKGGGNVTSAQGSAPLPLDERWHEWPGMLTKTLQAAITMS